MEAYKYYDFIRIFVFRPYTPIFLRKSEILSYENLLKEISKQYGIDIESLHLMNGMEIKNSNELKHDKVYIAVEKNFEDSETTNLSDYGSGTSTSESSTCSESASDSTLCNKIKENRKKWSKQFRLVSTDVASRGDISINIHSLYTYKNSLLPYGCTLKYRDLNSMEHVLIKLAFILKPPGHYIMGLYDIHKNEITDPSQLENEHHYLAMPHIISYNGYKLLKNLSPDLIEKYQLGNHENDVDEKKDKTTTMKRFVYDGKKIKKCVNSSLEQPKEEHVIVHLEKTSVAEKQPGEESCNTILEDTSSSSSSNASSKISYYTIENKSNKKLTTMREDHSHSDTSLKVPAEISYYTCSKKQKHPSNFAHPESYNQSNEKYHHKSCDDECQTGTAYDSHHSVEDLKQSLTAITKALGLQSLNKDAAPVLKKTSHHMNLQMEDNSSCNSSQQNCRNELAQNLLETLLHDIKHGKIKSPLLESNGGTTDKTESEIVEPLLLSCNLVIDVFQRISKSLNERKTN